jgi:hypothetical protein
MFSSCAVSHLAHTPTSQLSVTQMELAWSNQPSPPSRVSLQLRWTHTGRVVTISGTTAASVLLRGQMAYPVPADMEQGETEFHSREASRVGVQITQRSEPSTEDSKEDATQGPQDSMGTMRGSLTDCHRTSFI